MLNMVDLDLLDRKILSYLNSNVRATYSKIADHVNSSKEVVNYRIKRLEERKIILGYSTIFDIGYWSYKLLISFSKIDDVSDKKIITYLRKNKNIAWLTPCTGFCDLVLAVMAKSPKDFDNKIRLIFSEIGKYIQEYDVAISVYSKTTGHNFIYNNTNKTIEFEDEKVIKEKEEQHNNLNNIYFDEKDKKIGQIIKKNCRAKLIDICKKTNIKVDTIKYRIKKMEENGVIKRYRLLLDTSRLGYYRYELFLKCINLSGKVIDKFEEYAKTKKNIEFFSRCVGSWDIEFTIYLKTLEELRLFIFDIKKEFGEYIQKLESVTLFETYNFIYVPKELE